MTFLNFALLGGALALALGLFWLARPHAPPPERVGPIVRTAASPRSIAVQVTSTAADCM